MSRIHEPIQQHIHGDLCNEVNEMIINIKLHHIIQTESMEQLDKLIVARRRRHNPTWENIVELLSRVRDEMNECKQPFKRY